MSSSVSGLRWCKCWRRVLTIIQKWNTKWKKLCCLYCLSELAVLKLIFYSYNSVSDLRFSLLVELCNSKQVCCRKTIETTQFFSLSVSLLYHSASYILSVNLTWSSGDNKYYKQNFRKCSVSKKTTLTLFPSIGSHIGTPAVFFLWGMFLRWFWATRGLEGNRVK